LPISKIEVNEYSALNAGINASIESMVKTGQS